ncbi:hypothetical protein J1D01_14920 [Seonamhaeicola sp. NFXS20]|uniref:DUF6686 family protein n=1 Tax=Seonamhaeicola sp. NFXS20 TaxID=2816959 RepID=UPI003B8CF9B4
MCHQITTLAKNCLGKLSFCEDCQIYRLLFNNISIDFTEKELLIFQKFIKDLDIEYWCSKYNQTGIKRKIPIQTLQQNLSLVFNKQEFNSFKELVLLETKKPFSTLSVADVDYIFFLN